MRKNAFTSSGILWKILTWLHFPSRPAEIRGWVLLCFLWGRQESVQAHKILTQKQTQHCQSQRATRISSEFPLSPKFQIFRLISPIVRTFCAKSIKCRFTTSISLPLKIKWIPLTSELQRIVSLWKNHHAHISNLWSEIRFCFLRHIRIRIKLASIQEMFNEADDFKFA